jgi:hypothetical protein
MLRIIAIGVLVGFLAPAGLKSALFVCFADQGGSSASGLKEGQEVTIRGKVLGREKRPEGVADSDLALRVSTEKYNVVNVVYSAFRLCHNEVGASVKKGDRVEVYGKIIGKNRITVCLSKSYYIKRL